MTGTGLVIDKTEIDEKKGFRILSYQFLKYLLPLTINLLLNSVVHE